MRTTVVKQSITQHRDLVPISAVLLILLVLNGALQQNAFTLDNITTYLVQLAPYILVAMAQTVVMLVGGIDLSVGAVASLSSTLFATQLLHGPVNLLIIIGILLGMMVIGILTGLIISYLKIPSIVVTLASSFIWGGLALVVLPIPGGTVPEGTQLWFTGTMGPVPMILIILALCIVVWAYLRKTRTGVHLYEVGDNERGAHASGISGVNTYMTAFGFAALLTGLAGMVLSCQTSSGDPQIGMPFTMDSIAAAVLGGVSLFGGQGKMAGSIVGAIIIGMLVHVLFYVGVSSFYQHIVEGVILILAVALTSLRRRGGSQ